MTSRRASRTLQSESGASVVLVVISVVVVFGMMISGALLLSQRLKSKPQSCSAMARSSSTAAPTARRLNIIIGLSGNSEAVAVEAEQFVRQSLVRRSATDISVAKVTLLSGNHEFAAPHAVAGCLGRDLLVAPSSADLASYNSASKEAKRDVETTLRQQYDLQVDKVATAVGQAVRSAPKPADGSTGAFSVWPFVIQGSEGDVLVLSQFQLDGNNCLSLNNPATLGGEGLTAISERVKKCAEIGEVMVAPNERLSLSPSRSLPLTGDQKTAQSAIIEALCSFATAHGCLSPNIESRMK
jgi:hypothetical protein